MGRVAAALAVACTLGGQALAGGPVDDGVVARQLTWPDRRAREAALIEVVLRDDVGAVRVLGRVASEGEAATAVATARQARVISKRWEPFRRDLWTSASQESVARWSPSGHRDRSR
jgi:hypothetical protein